jgi:hypothetical protein
MPRYSGVTTSLDKARKQHQGKQSFRKWQLAKGGAPFPTRQSALDWLKTQPGEHDPFAAPSAGQWFGYTFEYGSS